MLKAIYSSAMRHLAKNRTAATLNISGIAIGIATSLLIMIWAHREFSFDSFHPDVDNRYRVWNTFKSESETFSQAPSGVALGAHLPKHIPAIVSSCRVFGGEFKFRYEDKTYFEQRAIPVDSNFFSFFGFPLLRGQADRVLRTPNEVVMTESTAIKYFGSVDAALDKMVMMDDKPMTISAVAADPPLNSHIQFDIVIPYEWLLTYALETWKEDLDNMWVGGWPGTYVQINDAANRDEVEKMVNDVVARFSKKAWEDNDMSYQYFMQPVRDIHLKSNLRYDSANNGSLMTVRVFIAVAIFILLLACINYINLTTAMALQRAKEISLRKLAGATRNQLMRQFFFETFVIAAISVSIALLILQLVLPSFSTWMGQPYHFAMDLRNVSIVAGFMIAITLLSGFYPSVILSSFQPVAALKGRFLHSERGQTARKALVILQFTISTVLLISILTVHQQMEFIRKTELGYKSDAVVAVNFNGEAEVQKKYETIRHSLLSAPYVLSVTRHNANVVGGLGNGWTTTENAKGEEVTTSIYRMNVDADYFETYGMELVAGRSFSKGTSDTSKSVLINEATVKMVGWPSVEDAIGKPFGKGEEARYVIGVVKDFHFESLHKRVEPLLIGHVQGGSSISLRIDRAHLQDGVGHLKTVWGKLVPDVPLQYSFIDDSLEQQYASEQKMESVFYIFAGLSFLIACMGLFGLSTFMMQQRVREIGIRKVLGAQVSSIILLLTTDFSKLVLVSALIAIPVGWYVMQEWLESFAYHTGIGWSTYALAVVIPVVIALLTVSIQSIRAALVNPTEILRAE
ncbi:MAG: ABC transporter permease [Cyclobacteriaceae bacterium]